MANPRLPIGALVKPLRGAKQLRARAKQAARRTAEAKEMQQARRRDGGKCRFPRCFCAKLHLTVHVCHLQHRGMGGNAKLDRTTTATLICLCAVRHGEWDRGEFEIIAQDLAQGFDGPVDFYVPDSEGRLECFARERRIGASVAVGG